MTLRLAVADADVCLCAQYEGISRMQTSLRRRHRDRVVRRGIGMMIGELSTSSAC